MIGKALQLSPVQLYLERLHEDLLKIQGGEVASYIPELTKADPAWLGIALVTVDGVFKHPRIDHILSGCSVLRLLERARR